METLTQTINILIGGDGTGLANTGTNTTLYTAIGISLIIAAVLFLLSRTRSLRTTFSKLTFRSLALFAFLSLATIGLALNLPQASATPTLTLGTSQDNLTITVPEGGGTTSTTTTLTSGTTNPTGYTLTASLTEAEPGIAIALTGGDITTSTALEPGSPALTLTTTDTATSNDTTDVTLNFTIDGTVTAGQKELKLSYTATDNEVPVPTTMQGMTASYCENNMTIYDGSNEDAILTLTDTRGDNQTYQVAKLADGNCWMLANLKLGSTSATTLLTPADTNIASNFTLPQLYSGASGDYFSYDDPFAYGPLPGDTGAGATNYGYLYNWPAATAGETRDSHDEDAGDAPYSICPANWRLPTSRWDADWEEVSGDFPALNIAWGGTGGGSWDGEPNIAQWNYNGAFKGTLAGYWWEGFYDQGDYGDVWSSSASPDDPGYAFYAYFGPSVVSPASGGGGGRAVGLSVRCLLQ